MKIITKKDIQKIIKELEEKGKVIPATTDAVFKSLFQDSSMRGILAYIINKVTLLKEDYLLKHMIFGNSEEAKNRIALKGNTTDLVVDVLNKKILLEMNQYNTKDNEFRNNAHYYGAIANDIRVNDNYLNIKQIYQINFDVEKAFTDNLIAEIVSIDKYTGIVDNDFYKKYRINLVKVRKKYYTEASKLSRFEKILLILQLEDKKELRKIARGDDELMKMVDRIEELSKDPDIVSFYDEEKLDKLAKSYGEYMAKEEGKAEGIALGKNEANLETAKKLLEENISIDIISKTTGLSKEAILTIKND